MVHWIEARHARKVANRGLNEDNDADSQLTLPSPLHILHNM